MGLFKEKEVVYKSVEEVDLGPNSDHVYLHANVKGSTYYLLTFASQSYLHSHSSFFFFFCHRIFNIS